MSSSEDLWVRAVGALEKKLPSIVSEPTSGQLMPSARVGVIAGMPAVRKRRRRVVGRRVASAARCSGPAISLAPNKAPEPTPTAVTCRADARPAPAVVVAHL